MQLTMVDLTTQYLEIENEVQAAIKDIVTSGRFILGPYGSAFEQEVAAYHRVHHAVGVASGTDALHLALMALEIRQGDEVITTSFSFIAAAEAIAYVGAKPIFADIQPDTFNINPSDIESLITPKTKCIIPVHLYGQPADMKQIMDIAARHRLAVIEDCAQAFGAEYNGVKVGSMGQIGCFSFYPSKNLGGYGDGGMMITNDRQLYEKLLLLRNHGSPGGYRHLFIGRNSRLDEIQAAILRIKFKRIDSYNQRRQQAAQLYHQLLSDVIACPSVKPDRTHVYHQYTIRHQHRDRLKQALQEKGIPSVVYYPIPLHLQDVFMNSSQPQRPLPEVESASKEVLSLPMYPELPEEQIRYIASTIKAISKNKFTN
jgi:dTDP-4-amino-4,6-dideoxygalactose transaminase